MHTHKHTHTRTYYLSHAHEHAGVPRFASVVSEMFCCRFSKDIEEQAAAISQLRLPQL